MFGMNYGVTMSERNIPPSEQDQFILGFLVHDVSRLRRAVIDHALKPLGLTRSQCWVLVNLHWHNGEPTRQTEFAKALDLGKVALGGLLDRLEANGYILRRPAPGDRRAKLVEITPAGTALLNDVQELTVRLNEEIMREFSDKEIEAAQDVLQRMKLRLIEMSNEAKGTGDDEPDDMEPHSAAG